MSVVTPQAAPLNYQNLCVEAARSLKALHAKNLTVATAESCTGGLLAAAFTEQAGSSATYLGGAASYSLTAKEVLLGVARPLLERCGAVSQEVAVAMAHGIRKQLGSSIGLAVTGLAGPGDDGSGLPIGTVWVAVVNREAAQSVCLQLAGDRAAVRFGSAQKVLEALNQFIIIEC